MKTLLVLFIAAFATYAVYAQKPPIKFGELTANDLLMAVYPKDELAEAVILVDFGESSIKSTQSGEFNLNIERTRRIKILRQEGVDLANFSIMLWHNDAKDADEQILKLQVSTFNIENGKVIESKAGKESFPREEFNEDVDIVHIAPVNVRVGSIVDIHYLVQSNFLFNLPDWQFQYTIPVVWSEYITDIPGFFTFKKSIQGFNGVLKSERSVRKSSLSLGGALRFEFGIEHTRWVAEDLPAFKSEPLIASAGNYILKLNLEMVSSKSPGRDEKDYTTNWNEIGRDYWDHVKNYTGNGEALRTDALRIASDGITPEQKALRIYEHVSNNIIWNQRLTKYQQTKPLGVMNEMKGTSGEINILLITLLKQVGIEAIPVLVSTRDHGFVDETAAMASQFNTVICLAKLGDRSVLLDGTAKNLPFGMLPIRCLNGKGLAVSDGSVEWVNLQPSSKSRTILNATMALETSGDLKGTLRVDMSGYHSADARSRYIEGGQQSYVNDILFRRLIEVDRSEFQNVSDVDQPFRQIIDLRVHDRSVVSNDLIYLTPIIIPQEPDNAFRSESREYPVDFGSPFEQIYTTVITLPEGFVAEELPKPEALSLPGNAARYVYNITQSGTTINLTSSLSVNKSVIDPEQYPRLRELYARLIAKQAEQIVLKRK